MDKDMVTKHIHEQHTYLVIWSVVCRFSQFKQYKIQMCFNHQYNTFKKIKKRNWRCCISLFLFKYFLSPVSRDSLMKNILKMIPYEIQIYRPFFVFPKMEMIYEK